MLLAKTQTHEGLLLGSLTSRRAALSLADVVPLLCIFEKLKTDLVSLLVWLLFDAQRVHGDRHTDVYKAAHQCVYRLIPSSIALSNHDLYIRQIRNGYG